MVTSSDDRLNILLIADNTDSIRVIRGALESSNTRCRLLMVGVGSSTLDYLRQEGPYADAPIPDLILYDIVDAEPESITVLKRIKADANFKAMPIVLLTNDDAAPAVEDIQLGRTQYTTFSPVDLESFLSALNAIQPNRFMHAISLLENFGFVLVRMPDTPLAGERDDDVELPVRPLLHSK